MSEFSSILARMKKNKELIIKIIKAIFFIFFNSILIDKYTILLKYYKFLVFF